MFAFPRCFQLASLLFGFVGIEDLRSVSALVLTTKTNGANGHAGSGNGHPAVADEADVGPSAVDPNALDWLQPQLAAATGARSAPLIMPPVADLAAASSGPSPKASSDFVKVEVVDDGPSTSAGSSPGGPEQRRRRRLRRSGSQTGEGKRRRSVGFDPFWLFGEICRGGGPRQGAFWS